MSLLRFPLIRYRFIALCLFAVASLSLNCAWAQDNDLILHVVSYNVGNVGAPGASPQQALDAIDPDDASWVLILQEVGGAQYMRTITELINARTGATYGFGYSARLRIGILCAGTPIQSTEYRQQFQGSESGALFATFGFGDRTVMFVGVHLAAIPKPRDTEGYVELNLGQLLGILGKEFFQSTSRSDAAQELVRVIAQNETDLAADVTVIGGDFNTVPASQTIRTMRKSYSDALDGTAGARKGTYWKLRFWFRPRVDFIFLSKSIRTLAGDVIQDRSADHLPVYAEIAIGSE